MSLFIYYYAKVELLWLLPNFNPEFVAGMFMVSTVGEVQCHVNDFLATDES